MENEIFINKKVWEEFIQEGYVLIENIVSQNVIEHLQKIYLNNYESKEGMYVTHTTSDYQKNFKISTTIFEILSDVISNIFFDEKKNIAHFAIKKANSENTFDLHQDWSIVDEKKYPIAHMWIPLQNTNKDNGTLTLIPRSHILTRKYRSGSCGINFLPRNILYEKALSIDVRKGDILIYHPALFHGSPSNQTATDRVSVIAAITHKNAPLIYYHKSGDKIIIYELNEKDLFSRLYELAQGMTPSGNQISVIDYKNSEFDILDLI
jgi:ectoine hydroxylase-related dioxygenase (phytanoyl-CoA dioxygenase family)